MSPASVVRDTDVFPLRFPSKIEVVHIVFDKHHMHSCQMFLRDSIIGVDTDFLVVQVLSMLQINIFINA